MTRIALLGDLVTSQDGDVLLQNLFISSLEMRRIPSRRTRSQIIGCGDDS